MVLVFVAGAGYLISRNLGGGGQARTIDVTVTGNKMTPSTLTARQGDILTIKVTADAKEEIHLHGYDIAFEVEKPGDTVTKTFKADKSGTYPIEIEETSTELGELVVNP